ncbi:hypothetical protein OAZ15_04785, partial [Pelagibacteraceae bacterium]|nr:hypothetical protein [Pelagibacteraceae bacterium]
MLIGFVGLTHLGLCTMSSCLLKNHKAIGFLESKKKINLDEIIYEQDLKKILINKKKKYKLTNNIKDLNKCDFIYVSYDVPTNSKGVSNLKNITNKINFLIKNLFEEIPIIILSQVPPGFTRSFLTKKTNIYYQVETLIFGSAIKRALKPERIIIGTENKKTKILKKYNNFLKSFSCPIIRMNYESAEFTKIAINIYLISSVSVTNMLSNISKSISSNWNDIKQALHLDKRIGKYAYLNPGLGLSGGNLERDLETINSITSKYPIENKFFKLYSKISTYSKNWPHRIFLKSMKEFDDLKNIGIMGLSYKKNTNSIKNSPSILLIKQINNYCNKKNKRIKIKVYDPVVKNKIISEKVIFMKSISKLIN